MRLRLLILVPFLFVGCAHRLVPDTRAYVPQPGDLLFQDLDGSPLCDAIETVTDGYHGARLSHVGMVLRQDGADWLIIEAGGRGVVLTPMSKFLARSRDAEGRPKVLVGRLVENARWRIPAALAFAEKQLGKPYDKPYVLRDDAYYCSELIWDACRERGTERHGDVFEPAPMTFKDPKTGEYYPAWVDYYKKLGAPIREGEPGVNPAAMSRARQVEIVHVLGQVSRK